MRLCIPTREPRIDVGRTKDEKRAPTLRGWRTSTDVTALRVILKRPTMFWRRRGQPRIDATEGKTRELN